MLVPSSFLSFCSFNNILFPSTHGPTHVRLVLACFLGSLLWVTPPSLSSVALWALPGPLRREPEWSCQNGAGSLPNEQRSPVLRCSDSPSAQHLEALATSHNVGLGVQLELPSHVIAEPTGSPGSSPYRSCCPQGLGCWAHAQLPEREGPAQADPSARAGFVIWQHAAPSHASGGERMDRDMKYAHLPRVI